MVLGGPVLTGMIPPKLGTFTSCLPVFDHRGRPDVEILEALDDAMALAVEAVTKGGAWKTGNYSHDNFLGFKDVGYFLELEISFEE